jgi:hypothetical protein
MSDIETNTGPEAAGDSRTDKAKALIGQAGQALKDEAQTFADLAQERARTEAQKHAQTATKTLGDFANAIRKAGDELGQADQSPAARLVRQAADGLEGVSRNLAGKQPEDILNDVRAFGRKNPAAFIGGAVLVGVALGRFVRASGGDGARSLAGATGGEPYELTETPTFGAESTGDEAIAQAEEDGFEGDAEFGGVQAQGIESAAGDDMTPTNLDDSTDATQVRGS